jgi:hypothetical protein
MIHCTEGSLENTGFPRLPGSEAVEPLSATAIAPKPVLVLVDCEGISMTFSLSSGGGIPGRLAGKYFLFIYRHN